MINGGALYFYRAKVDRVVDGDTVDFWVDLGLETWVRTRFRLFGINAPEVRGEERPRGLEATEWLKLQLADAHGIILKTWQDKKGKYGRWLCTIYVCDLSNNWHDLNTMMVSAGHAEWHKY